MSEMLRNLIIFMLIQNLKRNGCSARIKVKIEIYLQQFQFWAFSDMAMGCFRVIQNLVQFLQACKVSSPTDTMHENGSRKDF